MVIKLMKHANNISAKIRQLYAIVQELEQCYPGRKFTPDGHLVGSIGEVLAAEHYGLTLLPNSSETHDAVSDDGRLVQIKATQTKRIAISSEPEHLIVIKLAHNGSWEEIYNGPGAPVWQHAGKVQKNGQRPISIAKLKAIMNALPQSPLKGRNT